MSAGQDTTDLGRRQWLTTAGALGLVSLSANLASCSKPPEPAVLTEAETRFWQQSFPTLLDGTLATASLKGKPLVLNFWATWCPPCIEELPLLNAFYAENKTKGWQVLGLAVDQVGPVTRFLAQNPLAFRIAMAGFAGTEVSQSLGNVSGGLPFTVVFGAAGNVLHRKMGRLNAEDLRAWTAIPV
jgi:thiol-disulfide isomerase/thioredoxin